MDDVIPDSVTTIDKNYFDSCSSQEGSPVATSRALSPCHLLSQAEALVVFARQAGALPLRSPTPDSSTPLFGGGEAVEPATPARASPAATPSPPRTRELDAARKLQLIDEHSRTGSLTATDSDDRSCCSQSVSTAAGSDTTSAQQSLDYPDEIDFTGRQALAQAAARAAVQAGRQTGRRAVAQAAAQAVRQKAALKAATPHAVGQAGAQPVRQKAACKESTTRTVRRSSFAGLHALEQTTRSLQDLSSTALSRAQISGVDGADARQGDRGQPGAPGRHSSHTLGRRPAQQKRQRKEQRLSAPSSKVLTSSSTSCSTS